MADDVLTKEEVESLLRDLGEAAEKLSSQVLQGKRPTMAAATEAPKRPASETLLSQDHLETLRALHERVARGLGAALAPLLRSVVEVKVTAVAVKPFADFSRALANPSCLVLISAPPLEEHLLLEISPWIAYPIIDRMLGGGRETPLIAERPLTAIEKRLISRFMTPFNQELARAWQKVIALAPAVERTETNPEMTQILAAQDPIVAIHFQIAIGGARGSLKLGLPFASINKINSLAAQPLWVTRRDEATSLQGPHEPMVQVAVQLAKTKISAADLAGLEVGDIITTPATVGDSLAVTVDGVARFRGHPGAVAGRKAIQIDSPAPGHDHEPS